MKDSPCSSSASLSNPLDNVDTALMELTSKLIPGFAEEVAGSTKRDCVEKATAGAISQALTKTLGDACVIG